MIRRLVLTLATLSLLTGLAIADPSIRVIEGAGGIRVVLEGSYAQSTYRVWRSDGATAVYAPLMDRDVLCTGECYATDFDVTPGRTYFYRFDVRLADGTLAQFGPYAVTIADHPVGARLYPNPGSGATHVELSLPGGVRDASVDAQATIVDLQGRHVRTLLRGPLARGVTTLRWDGADAAGRRLGAGLYFLRFASPLGSRVVRVVRIR